MDQPGMSRHLTSYVKETGAFLDVTDLFVFVEVFTAVQTVLSAMLCTDCPTSARCWAVCNLREEPFELLLVDITETSFRHVDLVPVPVRTLFCTEYTDEPSSKSVHVP